MLSARPIMFEIPEWCASPFSMIEQAECGKPARKIDFSSIQKLALTIWQAIPVNQQVPWFVLLRNWALSIQTLISLLILPLTVDRRNAPKAMEPLAECVGASHCRCQRGRHKSVNTSIIRRDTCVILHITYNYLKIVVNKQIFILSMKLVCVMVYDL